MTAERRASSAQALASDTERRRSEAEEGRRALAGQLRAALDEIDVLRGVEGALRSQLVVVNGLATLPVARPDEGNRAARRQAQRQQRRER